MPMALLPLRRPLPAPFVRDCPCGLPPSASGKDSLQPAARGPPRRVRARSNCARSLLGIRCRPSPRTWPGGRPRSRRSSPPGRWIAGRLVGLAADADGGVGREKHALLVGQAGEERGIGGGNGGRSDEHKKDDEPTASDHSAAWSPSRRRSPTGRSDRWPGTSPCPTSSQSRRPAPPASILRRGGRRRRAVSSPSSSPRE